MCYNFHPPRRIAGTLREMTNEFIKIRGARQHNLKNVDLDIPKNKLVVLTGVSGSGKARLLLIHFMLKAKDAMLKAFLATPGNFWE